MKEAEITMDVMWVDVKAMHLQSIHYFTWKGMGKLDHPHVEIYSPLFANKKYIFPLSKLQKTSYPCQLSPPLQVNNEPSLMVLEDQTLMRMMMMMEVPGQVRLTVKLNLNLDNRERERRYSDIYWNLLRVHATHSSKSMKNYLCRSYFWTVPYYTSWFNLA